jgi:hypothetical protein
MTQRSLTKEQLETNAATQEHVDLVRFLLHEVAVELLQRGELHDRSKFYAPELDVFTEFTPKLKDSTYNSEEYKGFLKEMKPALDNHYQCNRHHPEHFQNGVAGMNLVDLVEMFCDWLASTRRHANGDIDKSIEISKERWGVTEQLASILRNSARAHRMHPAPDGGSGWDF